ncbi:ferric-chelate reductase [Massarina eburnea CBS 473.64]|uniref:Ferric-chelate reductase n=1 Tax=Massarina eburnea CBS 473.64 TaxID=1395130 RepID=A0A6A6S1F3_9PLEO|nr:ferric-chelate reductase [Massarina eburnea CBS 473.64]
MHPSPFLLLLSTWSFSSAEALRSGKWCFEGCELTLNYAEFNDTKLSLGSHKTRACQSQMANVSLPPYEVIDEYPKDERGEIKRLSADEGLRFPRLGEIVIPEEGFFERAFTTLDAAYFEYDIHQLYGWCMIYFWAIVITIGLVTRLLSLIPTLRHQQYQHVSTNLDTPSSPGFPRNQRTTSAFSALLKRHLTIPALFNNRCSQPLGWCTVPSRIQSLTIFSFVLINVVLCSTNYRVTHGNFYWPQEWIQLWRYVSDRTGIISLANFPMIWLFGMRNQVLMWITGWGYGTCNNFHRWVARVSTVQAVVHSVGYTIMVWERGGWKTLQKYLHKHYFWNGEITTISMCLILAFSVYGLRRSHYEVFLALHIILSIIVLLTMYYHVAIFTAGEWNVFIYPCLLVWVFDRALRTLRILSFDPKFWNTKAVATYDTHSNLVRMDVPFGNSVLKPRAGMYYYIYVLNDLFYAHQNHPFTLAYVTPRKGGTTHGDASPRPLLRPRPRRTSSAESTESDSLLSPPSSYESSPSLVFLIRPYDGFTSRLVKHASQSQLPTSLRVLIEGPYGQLRVLIEGPYGHTLPLHTYPNILFIVGGTGIAVPLSHITTLLGQDSAVTTVRIIWAVREHAFLASVLKDFEGLLDDERVIFEAHVTQDEESKDELESVLKRVRVEAGRPDVRTAVEEVTREAGQERLAVMACGPAQMADQARQASVEMLGKGYRGVEYFEESFKW